MAASLYRISFTLAGGARSIVKYLETAPSIGERLTFEHLVLEVTLVHHEPTGAGIAATVDATIETQTQTER